jgi:hypothetical protein
MRSMVNLDRDVYEFFSLYARGKGIPLGKARS